MAGEVYSPLAASPCIEVLSFTSSVLSSGKKPLPCLGSRQAARAAGRPGGRPAARPNTRVSLPCLGSQQAARAAARAGLPLPFTLCRYCVRVDFAPVKSGYDKVHNSMISTLRMKAILGCVHSGPHRRNFSRSLK